MKRFYDRRFVLSAMASAVLSACSSRPQVSHPNVDSATGHSKNKNANFYRHGVASGDPASDSVVLWTRLSVASTNSDANVSWELAESPDFNSLVAQGDCLTNKEKDFTVKVIPSRLNPGTTYYYRFVFRGSPSPVGRTKTLPTGRVEKYGVALASCSNFAFGYFNAYDAIAKDTNVDLVLHTGDYIYEYGAQGWGSEVAQKLNRVHEPAHETITLDDYRTRHAQYKTDKGSQAMHAAHPLVSCWDDHESANNPWLSGAQNHQTKTEGEWTDRRAASVQAYYEWMPIRDPKSMDERLAFSRAYKIGDLADLVTLETRHTARAEQINYLNYTDKINSIEDANRFKSMIIGAPGREMLSRRTEQLVKDTFTSTQHRPWRLLGNASPIARMLVPDINKLKILEDERPEQLETKAAKALKWKAKYNLPFYTDTWDGYPWARQKFYEACQSVDATDLIFLTGDSHSFWMNQLNDDHGTPMGIELGTAGITSPGDFIESGYSGDVARKLDRAFESQLDEVVWTDNFHQGYVRLNLTQSNAKTSFIAISTVEETNYTISTLKETVIERGHNGVQFKA
ncbi:alkaline phosphatase [Arenicella sp. 4NH20-0111]|uniref:alkaline phosphatase D family protein n=1 Tax=Arenicella sp. 4NH20-0111 TaxID=3127648 RepID=UPI0031050DEF